jgi:hypothetical protein
MDVEVKGIQSVIHFFPVNGSRYIWFLKRPYRISRSSYLKQVQIDVLKKVVAGIRCIKQSSLEKIIWAVLIFRI